MHESEDHDDESAAQRRLGSLISTLEVRKGLVAAGVITGLIGCGIGLALLAGAYLVPVNPRAKPLVQYGLFLAVGGLMLGGSAYLIATVVRRIGMRVYLHNGGLAIRRGERISVLPWGEIDIVWHKEKGAAISLEDKLGSVLEGSQCVYTLQAANLEQFVLDSYLPGIESLGQVIEHETLQHLLATARRSYEIEGLVEFGKLAVGREGLVKGNRLVPWNQVGRVTVDNGFVFIKKPDGGLASFGVRMGKVPNLHVYQALVESILERSKGPESPAQDRTRPH